MRKAYLTIDDSPSDSTVKKVDLLLKKGIPAMFFVRGDALENNLDPIVYALKKGFAVGNHAYSHTHFRHLSTEACLAEIEKTEALIERAFEEADVRQNKKYFRYPYGGKGNISYGSPRLFVKILDRKFRRINQYLKTANYTPLILNKLSLRYPERFMLNDVDSYWSIDLCEWHVSSLNRSIEEVLDDIDHRLTEKSGHEIILMHDHDETHQYFALIIERLLRHELEFLPFER